MHLKEVHMENFKSFGRKLTVPFARGFTAITGPNGSGKSNIGDAILFVLGPRSSKAIRAGKLVELIFNGGKDGKPAKECQVSLTFDNSDRLMPIDEDDVVLTRRIRKAPKPDDPDHAYSYFYVNGRAASLKEFADLLEHARISADGYNIVTQGHVTKIVEMGATDRRRIIEDIAGITEFDKDIDKALKQKEEVDANLERIGIVLDEIERTLRQLKKDRDGALRFQELSGLLKTAKGQHAWVLKANVERRIAGVQERITKLQEERTADVETVNALRGEERDALRRLTEVEEEIGETGGDELREIQAKIQGLRDERSKAEANQNYAHDEIEEIDKELEDLNKDLRRLKKSLDEASGEVETHDEHATAVRETADKLAKELEDAKDTVAQSDSDAMAVQKKLTELKRDHDKAVTERHEHELAVDRLADKKETLERVLEELTDAERTARTDIDETDWKLKELEDQVSGEALDKLQKRHFEKKKRQAEVTEEIQDLERTADRTRRQLADLRARKEAAEGVERAYSRAVDAVLSARDQGRLSGVCGTIAELGQVDPRFATAVETAAGGRSQCVVVETARDAQAAIEHLRQNKAGRATFLPLDKMAGNRPRGKALMAVKDPASHGFAIDLIEFNPKYEAAFQYVFGDTVVVNKLDDARRLMGGVRLVTTTGDLIEASGAMTGGATKKGKGGAGAFGGVDPKEIDRLSSELRAAETHVEGLSEEIAELRQEILELEDLIRQAKGSAEDLESKKDTLTKQRADADARHTKAQEALKTKSGEADALEKELQTHEDAIALLNDTLADMEAKRENLSKAMLSGTKKEIQDRIRQLEKDRDEAREAAREAEKKRDIARETMKLVEERVAEHQARVDKLVAEQDAHRADIEKLDGTIKARTEEIDALEAETSEASEAVRALQEEKEAVKDRLREIKSKIDKHAGQAETAYALIAKEKDSLPALEEQLGEAMIDLRETDYTPEEDEELPTLDSLRVEIRDLNRQIEALGPINQRALEEYEHQAERKEELDKEVAHLNEERDALTTLVDEISQRKKTRFMEVFDAINDNYQAVYPKLSMEGTGWLKLEDEEDPFAAGMTMMARPKGKRVLRIDAISGGEKSMAALAFIFAIQEYEPSPFYYLDEVDQNLDGVNSDTIGRMVKENSGKAQFIVVSLRKITLKQAEHIYGVTMQKVGVSEMIGNFDIGRVDESGKLVKKGQPDAKPPEEVLAADDPGVDKDDMDAEEATEALEAVVAEEVDHG